MSERDHAHDAAIVVLAIVLFVPLVIYGGWILSLLWNWFAVPTFGAPPLTVPVAIGLDALIQATKATPSADDDSNRFGRSILWHTMLLAIGFGAHGWAV